MGIKKCKTLVILIIYLFSSGLSNDAENWMLEERVFKKELIV
jgi:hypothetical protein